MKVLLTGGAGFIGRHVLRELLTRGHDVVVYDSLRADVHAAPPTDLEAPLMVADVRDPRALDAALARTDAVCHLAAKVGLGVDVQDLPDYADTNAHGTAALLAGMARHGVPWLAQASSMVVYGEGLARCDEHGLVRPAPRREQDLAEGRFEPPCPVCGRPLDPALVAEGAPMDPRNAYAASKVGQEQFAAAWAQAVDGRAVSLRYHNVYGPGMPDDTPYAGVASIFASALRRGHPPQVFEDGGQRRDFVHVRDVAAATVRALEATVSDQHRLSVAYNVGSGTVRTVGDMADALCRATGGPDPRITGRFRPGDVRHITADSTAVCVDLGWSAVESFDDGMAEFAASVSG